MSKLQAVQYLKNLNNMIEINFPVFVALVIGLTQVVKQFMGVNTLSNKITPIVALLFSLLLSMGANGLGFKSFLTGLIIWLSSMGLWSGTKTIVKN